MPDETLIASVFFAAIFLFGWRLHRSRTPRAVLSFAAGATASYVFVRMLPELNEAADAFVEETVGRGLPAPELRVFTAALIGFVVFYGLENLVGWSRGQEDEGSKSGTADRSAGRPLREWSDPVFLMHVGGFAFYAWIVCYLMVRGITEEPLPIALYALAMGLHFFGVDHALQREHGAAYLRVGRFVLAAAALAGWGVAIVTELPRTWIITGLGLISGGVVMNSMVMELPHEKDGRFWPFVAGAVAYTLLLLLVR
jgi:hypothetical protein